MSSSVKEMLRVYFLNGLPFIHSIFGLMDLSFTLGSKAGRTHGPLLQQDICLGNIFLTWGSDLGLCV